jgi:peptidoglycan L-alanyl-D-glutamate endopeptidase CwlK
MTTISASVGLGGANRKPDVEAVQKLLVKAGLKPGLIDGCFGPRTKSAILDFQHSFMAEPDGLLNPGGPTLRRLDIAAQDREVPIPPTPTTPRAAARAFTDWSGDSSKWPQEKKLASLNAGFRAKVVKVIERLAESGFQPNIVFGWRSTAVQKRLHDEGKTKVLFSFHNAQTPQGVPNAWAVDIVDKRWAWNEPDCHKFFKALGAEGKKEGLVWGGDWASFRDWAHLQGRQNGELGQVKRESGL